MGSDFTVLGIHEDGSIVSGELGMFQAFFSQLKQQRFPGRNLRKLHMYIGRAFERK